MDFDKRCEQHATVSDYFIWKYKQRHQEHHLRDSISEYKTNEYTVGNRDYVKLMVKDHRDGRAERALLGKGWIKLDEGPADEMMQCQECFEYEYYYEFYKYNLEELGTNLN